VRKFPARKVAEKLITVQQRTEIVVSLNRDRQGKEERDKQASRQRARERIAEQRRAGKRETVSIAVGQSTTSISQQ
jgi:hypothetical protein